MTVLYVHTSKKTSWYYFNEIKGGKWEETEMGHELRCRLSNDIVDLYNYYGNIYKSKAQEADDEEIKEIYDKRHTSFLKIQIQLKDSDIRIKL